MTKPLTEVVLSNGVVYRVGDTVTVGRGRSEWVVREFWFTAQGTPMVSLSARTGYAACSVTVERLVSRVAS